MYDVKTDKENGIVIVKAVLPPLLQAGKKSLSVAEVKNYLTSRNIKVKSFISGRNITNLNEEENLRSGTWVFELDNGKPTVVKSMNENRSTPQEETKAEIPRAKTRRKKTTQTKEA